MKRLTKPPYVSVNNIMYTDCLFYERWYNLPESRQTIYPVFSLYVDRKDCINARTTFIELRDPSGYKWAVKYLGDYNHWLRLQKSPWFREAYSAWRNELAELLKAEAFAKIIDIAGTDGPQALQAAKWLRDELSDGKAKTRGRPSKEEVDGELKALTKAATETDDDAERIGLTKLRVIEGGNKG